MRNLVCAVFILASVEFSTALAREPILLSVPNTANTADHALVLFPGWLGSARQSFGKIPQLIASDDLELAGAYSFGSQLMQKRKHAATERPLCVQISPVTRACTHKRAVRHVRYSRRSGHFMPRSACLLCATSGHPAHAHRAVCDLFRGHLSW
jgi:hypothetical protein